MIFSTTSGVTSVPKASALCCKARDTFAEIIIPIASESASISGFGEASSMWCPKDSQSSAVFLIEERTSSSIFTVFEGRCKAIFNLPGSFPLAERKVPEGAVGA